MWVLAAELFVGCKPRGFAFVGLFTFVVGSLDCFIGALMIVFVVRRCVVCVVMLLVGLLYVGCLVGRDLRFDVVYASCVYLLFECWFVCAFYLLVSLFLLRFVFGFV